MPVKLNGATSGSVELNVPAAIGSDLQLTLPATAGEVIVKAADGSVDLGSVDIDSSGNVGIGASSPTDKLHIVTGSNDEGILVKTTGNNSNALDFDANRAGAGNAIGSIRGKWNGTTVAQITFLSGADTTNKDDGVITFGTESAASNGNANAGEKLRIDSSGNVKVGISESLELRPGTNVANQIDFVSYNYATSSYLPVKNIASEWRWHDGDAGERMRIDSSGRVGVSRTSPFSQIHAYHATDNTILTLESGDSVSRINFIDSAGQAFIGNEGNAIVLATSSSATERLRIDSSGRVGIANTLSGTQDLSSSNLSVYGNSSTATGAIPISVHCGNVTSGRYMVGFYNGSGNVGNIFTSGTSTAYNTSSDYRLKENVVTIADGITRVKQLQPKRFNFIADDTTTVDGFIAHEAQAVVPEAVTGEKDGEEMQGIDQSKLVPLLTAALQEAIAKIETLETKVASLEASS